MDVGVHGHEKRSQGLANAVIVIDDKDGTVTEQRRHHHIMSHGNAPKRAAGSDCNTRRRACGSPAVAQRGVPAQ